MNEMMQARTLGTHRGTRTLHGVTAHGTSSPPAYARSGDLHIAYQTVGTGPIDLVVVEQWFSNVDAMWSFPPLSRLLNELASFSRVIGFDKRGTGLSDPIAVDALPAIEEWIDDLRAVLDAVGSERAVLLSGVGASVMALVFAATYPGWTSALVLVDGSARLAWSEDNPWGRRVDLLADDLERLRARWGTESGTLPLLAPNLMNDRELADMYLRYERQSASPGMAKAMIGWLYEVDVRPVLSAIRVPSLLLHHAEATRIAPAHGRHIAKQVKSARYVELAGADNYLWAGDTTALVAEVQEFLTGARPVLQPDRVLATALFTDIVDSTRLAAALGDRRWRDLLAAHNRKIRSILAVHRGREVKTTGDGFLATFDGSARAVRAAFSIREALAEQGMSVRTGLHTGEIEIADSDIAGITVHIAARINAIAEPGEVLVSSTVKELVTGSGLRFQQRGTHKLKGVPDEWRLFAASE
jgi:class 3 adenylate cyclase